MGLCEVKLEIVKHGWEMWDGEEVMGQAFVERRVVTQDQMGQ